MISLIHSLTTSNLESNLQIQKKEKVSDEGLNYDVKTKTLYRKKKDYDGILILLRSLFYQTKKLKKFYTICIAVLVEPINPVQSCTTVFNEWLTTGQL